MREGANAPPSGEFNMRKPFFNKEDLQRQDESNLEFMLIEIKEVLEEKKEKRRQEDWKKMLGCHAIIYHGLGKYLRED